MCTGARGQAVHSRARLSVDDLADLYAPDAVHEFPFTAPGFPPRFEGRDQIRDAYRAAWSASPVRWPHLRTGRVGA
ncbi:nuclear transport factor 2 family protein [Streptomyces sp. NPDC052396]|uniref:nuclear transport factor 2 family protein n=1 Tax=Streptomyces sp. NPDC052396 TaxID=3365689 RepID=UPI0037D45B98